MDFGNFVSAMLLPEAGFPSQILIAIAWEYGPRLKVGHEDGSVLSPHGRKKLYGELRAA